MKFFDPIFTLCIKCININLNSDILETGLFNILLLLIILFFTGYNFLIDLLEKRKKKIIKNIQYVEDLLYKAENRLFQVQNQLNKSNIIVNDIKYETILIKKILLNLNYYQVKKDLKINFNLGLKTFQLKEYQIFSEIKQKIIFLLLKHAVICAQKKFKSKKHATLFINNIINKLNGDLL